MATVDSVSREVSALGQRLSAVETELRIWSRIIGGIATAGVLVGIAGLSWAIHIGTKVAVIESGGNTKLVTELKSPASVQQLQANLTTVAAQVRTAQANHTAPNPSKVSALSDAVGLVIQQSPELPETWQAASALVGFRPAHSIAQELPPELAKIAEGPPGPNTGSCYEGNLTPMIDPSLPLDKAMTDTDVYLQDCTLDLQDIQGFAAFARRAEATYSRPIYAIYLIRVKLVYHGGPVIPVPVLKLIGCTFDFNVPVVPPARGQALLKALLAEPIKGVETIDLSSG